MWRSSDCHECSQSRVAMYGEYVEVRHPQAAYDPIPRPQIDDCRLLRHYNAR